MTVYAHQVLERFEERVRKRLEDGQRELWRHPAASTERKDVARMGKLQGLDLALGDLEEIKKEVEREQNAL